VEDILTAHVEEGRAQTLNYLLAKAIDSTSSDTISTSNIQEWSFEDIL
jgi:hypothetical protein